MVKEIYIVRHGETAWNLEERVQGQVDLESGLTEIGKLQAEEQGKKLGGIRFEKVYSSDLRRAKETTAAILAYVGDVPVEYVAELRERAFGSVQGKTIQEAGIRNYKRAETYALDQEGIFRDAEALGSVDDRVKRFINKILSSKESAILVVGHEWINSYLVNALLGEGYVFHGQGNASVHYVKLSDDEKVLESKLDNGS